MFTGDPEDALCEKILRSDGRNDAIVLSMIELVSDWPASATAGARQAFEERAAAPARWREVKERYFEYFRGLAAVWARA